MPPRSRAAVDSCCDRRGGICRTGLSLNMPAFLPIDCIFGKGRHVPDLVALVKPSRSCCCSELCAEASTEVCTESTQTNMAFKQKEKEIKQ